MRIVIYCGDGLLETATPCGLAVTF